MRRTERIVAISLGVVAVTATGCGIPGSGWARPGERPVALENDTIRCCSADEAC